MSSLKTEQIKRYNWRGIDSNGMRTQGTSEANNDETLTKSLHQQGITPTHIKQQRSLAIDWARNTIKRKDIQQFTRSLAMLLDAHIPLLDALTMLASNSHIKALRNLLGKITNHVNQGSSLHDALAQYPAYFDVIYIGLIQAGEMSGTLPTLLNEMANYQSRMQHLREKIQQALFYPCTVLVVALLITTGLLLFVVPQFQKIFQNFNATLPDFTLQVIKLSQLVQHYGISFSFTLALMILVARFIMKRSALLNEAKDYLLIKLPIIGTIICYSNIARWSRVLATTLSAGIPLIQAFESSLPLIHHAPTRRELTRAATNIESGSSFAKAMINIKMFPQDVRQMLAIGENAGRLPDMLDKIAQHYQSQLDQRMDNLSKLLEPVIMVLLASITGSLVIAMYLPVFKIGSVI